MAWNGSTGSVPKTAEKKPSLKRGIYAGLSVIGLATLVCVVVFSREKTVDVEPQSETLGKIADHAPSIATNIVVEPKVASKPIDPNARPTKVGEVVNGYVLLPSGRMHKRTGVITNNVANSFKLPCEIFDYPCENEIACYLTVKPGTSIVSVPPRPGRFTKDFLESIKHPIVINPDDSPETAELKRAVIDTKIELKAALDRGEDIEQTIADTRKELTELALYQTELKHQLWEFRQREDVSDADVEDFVTACNILLEKKGIAPMTLGPISRRKLTLKNYGE